MTVLCWMCVDEYVDPEDLIEWSRRIVGVVKKHPDARTAILDDDGIFVVYVGKATKAQLLKVVRAQRA